MSYITRSNIEDIFGIENIKTWADLQNNGDATSISTRITGAITYTQAEVDDRLRGSAYTVPLSEPTVQSLIDIAARIAGYWLWLSRGIDDEGKNESGMFDQMRMINKYFRDIHLGRRTLDLTTTRRHPEVIIEDVGSSQ